MNPFPPVCPGGYTKYYKSRDKPDSMTMQLQALPELCRLNNLPPPPRHTTTATISSSPPAPKPKAGPSSRQEPSLSRQDRSSRTARRKLSSIQESRFEAPLVTPSFASAITQSPSGHAASVSVQPKRSLRRTKRRILRTPSIQLEFQPCGGHVERMHDDDDDNETEQVQVGSAASRHLDRSGSTSTSSSSHFSSSTYRSQSTTSSSPTSTDSDMPRTPKDRWPRAHDIPFRKEEEEEMPPRYGIPELTDGYESDDSEDGYDYDPLRRPDSWSSYRTARSQFSEL